MAFEISATALFSDTQVSDIFIKEYLPALDGDSVKVYLLCAYLSKQQEKIELCRLPALSDMEQACVERSLTLLQSFGLLQVKQDQIQLCDLKEKALQQYYRPKECVDPVKTTPKRAGCNTVRENTIRHISDKFFNGQMNHLWYREIDLWFEKYGFEDAVMIMLLQHCENLIGRSSLNTKYAGTVAETWAKAGVKTVEELERYMMQYDKYKEFRRTVTRNAAIRNLDKYQEAVLEKWFFTYGYDFDIVEEALKKSVALKNPSVATYDLYLTEWHQAGLRTKDAVIAYETEKKQKYQTQKKPSSQKSGKPSTGTSGWEYEGQRKYDDAFFDALEKKAGKKQ